MLIVSSDSIAVETELRTGRLSCPSCAGELGPWGHACERAVRRGRTEERVHPRRSRCRSCRHTHVLLPDTTLLRRRDHVEVIGSALEARARGCGYRLIAGMLGESRFSVRNWLRSFAALAEQVRIHFTTSAYALDPELQPIEPAGSPVRDALDAIGVAVRAAVQRHGPQPAWCVASRLCNGVLLNNAICHLPRPT